MTKISEQLAFYAHDKNNLLAKNDQKLIKQKVERKRSNESVRRERKKAILNDYSYFKQIYDSRETTGDIELIFKYGVLMKAHRFVLASVSSSMLKIFFGSTGGSNRNSFNGEPTKVLKSYIFNEIESKLGEIVLKMCYNVEEDLNLLAVDTLVNILKIVNKHQMINLSQKLCKHMNQLTVTKENVRELSRITETNLNELSVLKAHCDHYYMKTGAQITDIGSVYYPLKQYVTKVDGCDKNQNEMFNVKYGPIKEKIHCTSHPIRENKSDGISIAFASQIAMNYIQLRLYDRNSVSFSYFIEISSDNKSWQRICDYSEFQCRSWQHIYFNQTAVQHIRIIGVKCYDNCHTESDQSFQISSIECMLINSQTVHRPIGKHLVPTSNIALTTNGAKLLRGVNDWCIRGQQFNDTDIVNYTSHHPWGAIVIQLSQPVLVDSMRVQTWLNSLYNIYVSVSVDNRRWIDVYEKRELSARHKSHTIKFALQFVSFIKVYGENVNIHDIYDDTFRCVLLECPYN